MVNVERAREILNKDNKELEITDEKLQSIVNFLYSLCNKVVDEFENCHE